MNAKVQEEYLYIRTRWGDISDILASWAPPNLGPYAYTQSARAKRNVTETETIKDLYSLGNVVAAFGYAGTPLVLGSSSIGGQNLAKTVQEYNGDILAETVQLPIGRPSLASQQILGEPTKALNCRHFYFPDDTLTSLTIPFTTPAKSYKYDSSSDATGHDISGNVFFKGVKYHPPREHDYSTAGSVLEYWSSEYLALPYFLRYPWRLSQSMGRIFSGWNAITNEMDDATFDLRKYITELDTHYTFGRMGTMFDNCIFLSRYSHLFASASDSSAPLPTAFSPLDVDSANFPIGTVKYRDNYGEVIPSINDGRYYFQGEHPLEPPYNRRNKNVFRPVSGYPGRKFEARTRWNPATSADAPAWEFVRVDSGLELTDGGSYWDEGVRFDWLTSFSIAYSDDDYADGAPFHVFGGTTKTLFKKDNFQCLFVPLFSDFTHATCSLEGNTVAINSHGAAEYSSASNVFDIDIVELRNAEGITRFAVKKWPTHLLPLTSYKYDDPYIWIYASVGASIVTPSLTGRTLSCALPQKTELYLSRTARAASQNVARSFNGDALIHPCAEYVGDFSSGTVEIPARYSGIWFAQVYDAYYGHMYELQISV
jgi:hypothetical protein